MRILAVWTNEAGVVEEKALIGELTITTHEIRFFLKQAMGPDTRPKAGRSGIKPGSDLETLKHVLNEKPGNMYARVTLENRFVDANGNEATEPIEYEVCAKPDGPCLRLRSECANDRMIFEYLFTQRDDGCVLSSQWLPDGTPTIHSRPRNMNEAAPKQSKFNLRGMGRADLEALAAEKSFDIPGGMKDRELELALVKHMEKTEKTPVTAGK